MNKYLVRDVEGKCHIYETTKKLESITALYNIGGISFTVLQEIGNLPRIGKVHQPNRAELLAKYWYFGQEIIPVDTKEYFEVMQANITGLHVKHYHPDVSSEAMEFTVGDYAYSSFGVTYNVGWEGDKDHESFKFKIKQMTKEERQKMMDILSHQNVIEGDICIGNDDINLL